MNKNIVLIVSLLVLLLVSLAVFSYYRGVEPALQVPSPQATSTEVVVVPATTTVNPSSTVINVPVPEAVRIARAKAAEQAGVGVNQAVVTEFKAREWPNSCLGLAASGEMCAQVITPGYRIVVSTNGKQFIYRTNQTGSVIRQES